ncbi:DUF4232 domain-containing protein [Streptomyces sp. NPDC089915]|uniref:DUF4232 domain-containing protein n=1 Tax=Streptomyces sp. NPDC089915 TaxID=3155186 RepID=UPI003431C209
MSGNRRKAFLVSAVLMGGAMLLTACQDSDGATDTGAQGGASAAPAASAPTGGKPADGKGSGTTGKPSGATAGSGTGTGGKPGGRACGAKDIDWSAKTESQAGGYILITAKAKSGITCYLPAALPTVAFGSDGTEAGPAEQSAAKQIQLSGNTAAYAGVNPKTTKENGGKELESIIVAVGDSDPDPESLKVGTITVNHPVVTNWHTSPKDAVPVK